MNLKKIRTLNLISTLFILGSPCAIAADALPGDAAAEQPSVFATIGKETITWQDFGIAFNNAAKNKFFHGKPADDVTAALQREVAGKLITQALLVNEANRRKIKPDTALVTQELEKIEKMRAGNAQWTEARNRVLPVLTKQIEDESKVKKLTALIREVTQPTKAQVQAYYTSHPEKFTAPVEQRVSVILLSVDPSSDQQTWAQTIEDANTLLKRIKNGESFAEMAKQYSKDAETVDQGGDMGYLHAGMLAETSEAAIKALQVGEVTNPIQLLQGIALFQLTNRNPSKLSGFDSVAERAKELWLADASDNAWKKFEDNLRKKTPMKIDETKFLPQAPAEIKPEAPAKNP